MWPGLKLLFVCLGAWYTRNIKATIIIASEALTSQVDEPQTCASSDTLKPTDDYISKVAQSCHAISVVIFHWGKYMQTWKNYHFHYCHDNTTVKSAHKLLHSNSMFINGNEIIDKPQLWKKWYFMRILLNTQKPNPVLFWTVITVLFVSQRQAVITRFYSIACLVRTELNTLIGKPLVFNQWITNWR